MRKMLVPIAVLTGLAAARVGASIPKPTSDKRPTPTEDADFKTTFDVLQRSGEGFRKIAYSFLLIYGALMLWALNAVVYPAEQQRLGQIARNNAEVITCLIALWPPREPLSIGSQTASSPATTTSSITAVTPGTSSSNPCDAILDGKSIAYQHKDYVRSTASDGKQFDLPKMDLDYIEHEAQSQLDKSAEVAVFHVPIIGIASDRTWLWLVNCAAGLFLYYLIRDALTNLRRLLRFVYSRLDDKEYRRVLLATTQIITSSGPEGTGKSHRPKLYLMRFIFSLPIAVSALLLYDWHYYLFHPGISLANQPPPLSGMTRVAVDFLNVFSIERKSLNSEFISEPEFWGGIITGMALIWQFVIFLSICSLLGSLSGLHEELKT